MRKLKANYCNHRSIWRAEVICHGLLLAICSYCYYYFFSIGQRVAPPPPAKQASLPIVSLPL